MFHRKNLHLFYSYFIYLFFYIRYFGDQIFKFRISKKDFNIYFNDIEKRKLLKTNKKKTKRY